MKDAHRPTTDVLTELLGRELSAHVVELRGGHRDASPLSNGGG